MKTYKLDTSNGYKIIIEKANTGHRFAALESCYEFKTIDEVCSFLKEKMGVTEQNITKRDAQQEHGVLADTSWYKVVKKYRDIPECYLR